MSIRYTPLQFSKEIGKSYGIVLSMLDKELKPYVVYTDDTPMIDEQAIKMFVDAGAAQEESKAEDIGGPQENAEAEAQIDYKDALIQYLTNQIERQDETIQRLEAKIAEKDKFIEDMARKQSEIIQANQVLMGQQNEIKLLESGKRRMGLFERIFKGNRKGQEDV